MRISQLLEDKSPPFHVKEFMDEWRALALSPFELTIDGTGKNASSGFPLHRKAGTWFGGALIPRGGFGKEPGRLLSVTHRGRAFLKALGKSLAEVIKSGREVRVTGDFGLASDPMRYTTVAPSTAENVTEHLLSRVTTENRDHRNGTDKVLRTHWHVTSLPEDYE